MSPGRAYRLWRLAKLQVPRKRGRKRVAASRPRPRAPAAANQVWSYDFVFGHCASGQRLKCLTVTDAFTKEGLAIDIGARIRSARVIQVLSGLVSARGAPAFAASLARAASCEATGWDAAVSGAYASQPVASPPILGHTEKMEADLSREKWSEETGRVTMGFAEGLG
jgi:transposase InsO family protein